MNRTFGVIGGDRRQEALASLLRAEGRMVWTYGVGEESGTLEQAAAADVVLLPLPLCREEGVVNCAGAPLTTEALFRRFRRGQLLLAGQVKPAQQAEAASRGLTLEDYFLREELAVANAAATAEAALQAAMERLDRTLLNMDCLVLGFGRIGKLLSFRLHGLGARVTAAARKPADRAWIRACGWQALDSGSLSGHLSGFGTVFNTAPALLLDHPLLAELPDHCLVVDLASVTGVDTAAAEKLGIPYIWARSLPGRLKPASAAAAIWEAVSHILIERGDTL